VGDLAEWIEDQVHEFHAEAANRRQHLAAQSRQAISTPFQKQPIKRPTLADITSKGPALPNRYGIGAVDKFGKTSLGAKFPKPIFIESRGETGLETLIDAGRLPETPHFPECVDWQSVLGSLDTLLEDEHDFRTVVIDTVNGAERLCHEFTCAEDYGNDWGPQGFANYGKGPETALVHWKELLSKLDRLRAEKKMTVVMLYHMKVKNFKNPLGADYDRYEPEMNEKTWGLTKKWLDVILFGNFETSVTKVKETKDTIKGKAVGGQIRLLYTERTAAYDAGNRLGLPPEIELGDSPDEAWANFSNAVRTAKAATQTAQAAAQTAQAAETQGEQSNG
jgi:hypothetical protein